MSSELSHAEYYLIMDFLYKLYRGSDYNENVKVEFIFEYFPQVNSIEKIDCTFASSESEKGFSNWYLIKMNFFGEDCWLSARSYINEELSPVTIIHYEMRFFPLIEKSEIEDDILVKLKSEAILKSRIHCRTFKLTAGKDAKSIIDLTKIIHPQSVSLQTIFLPEKKKKYLQLFIETVLSYKRTPLRYLFSGAPGTGKTQIINAIINCVAGSITTIILENRYINLSDVFTFCSLFDPCLLIIDDIDVYLEHRNVSQTRRELFSFLSLLDGYEKENIFILATTNDKTLVDVAAQRPGRFDLIFDIDEITPDNYFDLIERETDNEEITSLFTGDILEQFSHKRVTGAFIVTLIKQLINLYEINDRVSRQDLEELFTISYNGFYRTNSDNKKLIGLY